jgi:hypothetical protein
MRARYPEDCNTVEALLRLYTATDAGREFALKMYTDEGNRDLVGNNARESR